MAGRWFDELPVGTVVHHAVTRTVTESDNVLFSCLTMNPQPLHLDEQFASTTEFGQRLINSLLTLALLVGCSVYDLTLGTTVANLGFTSVEFPAPMYHGDTLRAETEVVAARPSRLASRANSASIRGRWNSRTTRSPHQQQSFIAPAALSTRSSSTVVASWWSKAERSTTSSPPKPERFSTGATDEQQRL